MRPAFDEILKFFWEYPEYWNAWKLAFENEASRRLLIIRIVRMLPARWGTVDFLEDFGDDRFILLFTHDLDNNGARKNEFQIVLPFMETSALRFIGAEGATGRIDLDRFYAFPHQNTIRTVAEYMFREREISPIITAAFYSSTKAEIWGVEDPDLYDRTRKSLLENRPDYWSLVRQRIPIMFENLLQMMTERNEKVAGATFTDYNFSEGHSFLRARQISHAGIRANSEGRTEFGQTIREMKAPPTPLEKLFADTTEKEKARSRQWYREFRNKKST